MCFGGDDSAGNVPNGEIPSWYNTPREKWGELSDSDWEEFVKAHGPAAALRNDVYAITGMQTEATRRAAAREKTLALKQQRDQEVARMSKIHGRDQNILTDPLQKAAEKAAGDLGGSVL